MIHRVRELRQEEGFTLVELLIVIVILGVLAGIVVFAVSGINNRGVAASCRADFKSVQVAQEAKYAKDGAYADTVGALVTAGFLRDAPSNPQYTISIDAAAANKPVTVNGTAAITPCNAL